MKVCVQLGLLCLSLLISSLHGEEEDENISMYEPPKFDEPDLYQLEMHRVRREAENQDSTGKAAVGTQTGNGKKKGIKRPRQGFQSLLGNPPPNINQRTKRHDNDRSNTRTRPRKYSPLGSEVAQQQKMVIT